MKGTLGWRFLLIIAVLIGALIFLFPTFVKETPSWWPKFFPQDKIHLGLDLRGGVYLDLEVQTDKAIESKLDAIKNDLKNGLDKEGIFYTSLERVAGNTIEVVLLNPDVKKKFDAYRKDRYPDLNPIGEPVVEGDRVKVKLGMNLAQIEEIRKSAAEKAVETIRNRIDEKGILEPEITQATGNRILVQIPDVKDPGEIKELIQKVAFLEFKLVDEDNDLNRALAGNVPFGDIILYHQEKDPDTHEVRKTPYLIKDKTLMKGDAVKDARISFDQYNRRYIALSFTSAGAKVFDQITGENVGRRLAIILDNNIYSAPVIRTRISEGKAQIEGTFSDREAKDLVIALRSQMPAPVEIQSEKYVGPALGQDSINKGIKSAIVGTLLVVLFMLVYYRLSGLVANIALSMNIVLLLGALAALGATLTLPGIAGIALTVGMAVDANVLIYERIREEMRLGKPPRTALDAGYSRAFLTVVDTHVTTFISALVLLQFGTGPIKGFATTLALGVAASMFTAFVVTKFIFDYVLSKVHVKRLSV